MYKINVAKDALIHIVIIFKEIYYER